MTKAIDYNAFSEILDNSWGRSSTPKTASYSVKFSYKMGNKLVATYICVMNFSSTGEAQMIKKTTSEDADKLIEMYKKSLKSKYKELTGESLTLKDVDSSDSVEMLSGGHSHTSKRTAYYRKTFTFEMS